jgi:hypothetical protein
MVLMVVKHDLPCLIKFPAFAPPNQAGEYSPKSDKLNTYIHFHQHWPQTACAADHEGWVRLLLVHVDVRLHAWLCVRPDENATYVAGRAKLWSSANVKDKLIPHSE